MKHHGSPLIVLAAAATLAVLAGPAWAATSIVDMKSGPNVFTPTPVTVTVGDTVRFQIVTGTHDVADDNGAFTSGNLSGSQFFDFVYTTPGTFPYHCVRHGAAGGIGMSGQVIVNDVPPAVPELPLPAVALGLAATTMGLAVRRRRRLAN